MQFQVKINKILIHIDKNLQKDGNRIREKIENLLNRLDDKINICKQKQDHINNYRQQIYDKIDQFFDVVIERVNKRRETLKNQYKNIEAKEKRKLKSK